MKKCIALLLGLLISPALSFAAVFTDINSSHPYYEAISYLHEKGVINGYDDNSFRPDKKVNRAEALKIILLGSNIFVPEIQAQEVFPDVLSDAWYGKFAAKAKNLKIIKGDADTGLFRPGDTVNLAEALKILLEANGTKTIQPDESPYLDVETDAWYAPYFSYAQGAQLIDQSRNETVNPSLPITRGLLAELMYRLANTSYIEPDGEASYYGEKFHGKTTANGETFDASTFTAAHRTYAFDTWLKVTNVANGKSVKVRVNDRGPYAGDNRIIDLSKAAFESISPLSRGIINVAIEKTSPPSETELATQKSTNNTDTEIKINNASKFLNQNKVACPEIASLQNISADFFENITLDQAIPNRFLADEVLTLNGSTTSSADKLTGFLVDEQDQQTSFSTDIKNKSFSLNIHFPKTGTYKIGLLPGESGQSLIKEITVVKNECIEEVEDSNLSKLSPPTFELSSGDLMTKWNRDSYNLFKITFAQGNLNKSYLVHGLSQWIPNYNDFKDFSAGAVKVYLRGANLSENSVLSPDQIKWSPAIESDFTAVQHEEYFINQKEVEVLKLSKDFSTGEEIEIQFKASVPIRSKMALILPSGKVEEVDLKSDSNANIKKIDSVEIFEASNNTLSSGYKTTSSGTYYLEINNDQGLAVVNVPVYARNQYPLLPNQRDLAQKSTANLSGSLNNWQSTMHSLVNQDRSRYQLPNLKLDDKLSALAQHRSDDMAANHYFSHWDQQGRNANDIRSNYGIQTLVGENLARDLNLELAQYGLMRSAIHRSNILSDEWTRIGIGVAKTEDGTYVITQIFSTDPIDLSNIDELRQSMLNSINQSRSSNISFNNTLNQVAQDWSEKMVSESFFDFVSGDGKSLIEEVRNAGISASLGTYILGNSSFSDALEQLKQNQQITESKWKSIGIGIKQDNLGLINITLVYSE